jgi:hypothetical protein
MNTKIQQLAKQAGIIGQSENGIAPPIERFAELIVKECDLYARRNWEHGTLLGGDLLNYFGVEECNKK